MNQPVREVALKLWNRGEEWAVRSHVRDELNDLGLYVSEDADGFTKPRDLEAFRARLRELNEAGELM